MTQEKRDKLLREKINGFNPLSGGIVFGKEEAWDKLQQRIEQKPAKKIAIKYWLAAAAVLLVMICVTAIYNTPSQQVVKNNDRRAHEENIVAQQATVEQPVSNTQKLKMPVVSTSVQNASVSVRVRHTENPVINNTPQIPVPQDEYIEENQIVTVTLPAPVIPSPQSMKVIHINDLERGTVVPQQTSSNEYVSIDVSKLPVVHISDVIHQEYEVRKILKENRASFIHISFTQNGIPQDDISVDKDPFPSKLKIRFNPQN